MRAIKAGYFATQLSIVTRGLFAFAGMMALLPSGLFPGAVITDIVGVVFGAALMWRDVRLGRIMSAPTGH